MQHEQSSLTCILLLRTLSEQSCNYINLKLTEDPLLVIINAL